MDENNEGLTDTENQRGSGYLLASCVSTFACVHTYATNFNTTIYLKSKCRCIYLNLTAFHKWCISALGWTLYCLVMHREHQEVCRKEIREMLAGRDYITWWAINYHYTVINIRCAEGCCSCLVQYSSGRSQLPDTSFIRWKYGAIMLLWVNYTI